MFLSRFALKTAVSLVIMLVFSASAAAYIPPAPFIIDLMVKNRKPPEQLQITQEIRLYPESEQEPEILEQKVYFRLPGAFRSEISNDDLNRIHISNRGSSVTVIDGRLFEGRQPWHSCYRDLFFLNSRKSVLEYLFEQGIDANISSLGRLDKKLVYVIGARYPNETSRQLWISKESFHPVRWIVTPAKKSGEPAVHEIRYGDWKRVENTWYPGEIKFYERGEEFQTMIVKEIKINPSMPGDLFDAEALGRSASGKPEDKEKKDKPGGTGGEIRRQIEEFKNIYESGQE
ncbi:MAG: hypothetical protein ACOC03_02135 [Desulfosalsimonas sp.]